MSNYHGRRGPNVSQYVANLNTVPTQHEPLAEPLDLDTDLSLFANSDFIDWEGAGEFDANAAGLDFDIESETQARTNSTNKSTAQPKMDSFTLPGGDFQFADFSNFQDPIVTQPMQHLSQSQAGAYPLQPTYTSPVSPVTPHFDQSGKKRRFEDSDANSQQPTDETARVAAEEDKRRRNTAASARFRIKKKQREQALEKTAKEMTERVSVLETRIQQLETENTWLKSLITEKNGGKASTSDISALLRKHVEENAAERKGDRRTDGVGTESKDTKA